MIIHVANPMYDSVFNTQATADTEMRQISKLVGLQSDVLDEILKD